MMRHLATVLRNVPWVVDWARWFWRLRQPKFTAGAVAVVFNSQGQVLLVEHVFHPYMPWGLPGGWVGRREDPAETVRRELQEELGLTIEVGPILLIELGYGNHLDMAYLGRTEDSVSNLSRELLAYRWCDVAQLPILHSFHYRAITLAQSILKPGISVSS